MQNPSDFNKLKKTVQIFDSTSEHYRNLRDNIVQRQIIYFDDIRNNLQSKLNHNVESFNYSELVGTSTDKYGNPAKKRRFAEANALIQISCLPQQWRRTGRHFTDDWTSDGFLRWAVTLNFVEHDRDTDFFNITSLGRDFSQTLEGSDVESNQLIFALLKYPPATQVLNFLNENPGYHTKFAIGEHLGFRGEKGFTSYDETLMMDWLKTATSSEISAIRNNVEGTSDKYARMISTWLKKLGLVSSHTEKIHTGTDSLSSFMGYSITAKGQHAIQQAQGFSRNNRTEKFIKWEFLATIAKNRDYIRTRRAYILKLLQETKSFNVLINKMQQIGFNDDETIIRNDINGLNTFGIRIVQNDNLVELKDTFNDFTIPTLDVTSILQDEDNERRKADLMRRTNLEPKYIELLEIAYDGNRNRDFEMITIELFRKVYGYQSILLGGGRKPDGLVFTDKFGVIIDTKAYSRGYPKNIIQADQMIRYIEDNQRRDPERNPTEWWTDFDSNIPSDQFYFMWVSSKFIGRFPEQIEYTSNQTETNGGALNVEQLLLGADAVAKGQLDASQLPYYMNNTEIIWV